MAIQSVTVTLDSTSVPGVWIFYVGKTGFPVTPADFQQMMLTANADGGGAGHVVKNIAMACSIGAVVATPANIATLLAGRTFRI